MHIEKMKLSDLRPAEYNPRVKLNPGMAEYEKLKQSILEFGFIGPPTFNRDTENLIGGYQHVTVAKELGLFDEIEISVVDLPLDKEKVLSIVLNKISGNWNEDKLTELLNELTADDLELTGFDNEELEILIEDADIPNFEPGSIGDQGNSAKLEPKFIKYPCCGEEFDLRDVES